MNFIYLLKYAPTLRHAAIPLLTMVLLSCAKVFYIFLNLLLMPAVFDRLFVSFDVMVLLKIIGLLVALLGFTLFLDVMIETVGSHIHFKLSSRIKVRLVDKALRFPYSFYNDSNSGELSKLIVRDTDSVALGLKELVMTATNMVQIVLMAVGCYIIAPWYLKIYAVMIGIYFAWNLFWKPIYFAVAEKYGRINTESYGFLWGSIGAFREVKILGLENAKMKEFGNIQGRQKHTLWFHDILNYMIMFLNQPLGSLGYAIILYIVLVKVQGGEYSLGMMSAFTSVVYLLLTPIVNITLCFTGIQTGMAGAKLLKDLNHTKPEPTGKLKCAGISGDIEINNVSFSYNPERIILKGVTVRIPKGKHVGIVGHTGCGKSTLLSLLLKLHHQYEGNITIGGTAISAFENDSLRDTISYLGQDSLCFIGTVRDNIDPLKKYSDKQILEICHSVQMDEILSRLEGGLNAKVTDESLSGGERQRLFLARAIAKNAELLIFDEATSALDGKTEHLVLETLKQLRQSKTAITVAHRLSNVRECDTIYVLENGEVVESGTYEELMTNKKNFYNLFMTSES